MVIPTMLQGVPSGRWRSSTAGLGCLDVAARRAIRDRHFVTDQVRGVTVSP